MDRFQLLKSELFDLLFNGQVVNRQELLMTLLHYVQEYYAAKDVTLYSQDYTSNRLNKVNSTSEKIMNNADYHTNLFSSHLELLDEGKVKIVTTDIHHLVLIPLSLKNNKLELIVMTILIENEIFNEINWDEISGIFSAFLNKVYEFVNLSDEFKRYEQLYRVTSKFHSSMNMDDVLKEVIETLREVYPSFTYYLLLSHDYNHLNDLPIKEIQYDESNMAVTQAFVTGEIQLEDRVTERTSILYAPLKGRQGVYGVLQMIAPNTLFFPKEEISFVTLLANTAGSAIENAKLYQQSNRLIADLQLINETSHQLNSNLRLTEAMGYMSNRIITSFQADEVGFILFEDDQSFQILPGSTKYFSENAKTVIEYVYRKLMVDRESIFQGDLVSDSQMKHIQYRSLMAVPMIQGSVLRGVSIVLQAKPYAFSFETFKLLQSLIHHSTLALSNSMLREELEKLVITDHLTKLNSRNYINDKINKSMETDAFGTFLLIDIDNFKSVNDTFGHQVGDEVLKQVAEIIKENIREFDVGARWGGEELAVYLPRVDTSSGIAVAERLVQKVMEFTDPKVTISCGVSHWAKGHSDTPITLFKRADEALYRAKGTGKNRINVQEQLYN